MTTIVGVQKNGHVIMGADSLVTAGVKKYIHKDMPKIINNNGYLIGGAGDVAACDILMYMWIPPMPTAAQRKNLYKFMITDVVPSMREALEENGYKTDKEDKESGFETLIAVDGEIFNISDDFSVLIDETGIYGVGSGSPWAVAALDAGTTVEKALEIAAKRNPYTDGPFQIVKQQKQIKTK
jgi:ATP-dependent protease HslVU (ClpYQ) peptidase subunit